jgi:hypothetical protein
MKKLLAAAMVLSLLGVVVGGCVFFKWMCRAQDYRCHLMYHGTTHAYTHCDWCQGRTHDTYTLGF